VVAISGAVVRGATALGALALAACGGRAAPAGAAPASPGTGAPVVLAIGRAFVLEAGGVPAGDTTVTFPAGAARVIVLRHGPPDRTVFAELRFPAGTFRAAPAETVSVTVRPLPGLFGLELVTSAEFAGEGALVFRYARNFLAPMGSTARYPDNSALERALSVAWLQPDATLLLLPSRRPAADNLQAPLRAGGRYLLVAPA